MLKSELNSILEEFDGYVIAGFLAENDYDSIDDIPISVDDKDHEPFTPDSLRNALNKSYNGQHADRPTVIVWSVEPKEIDVNGETYYAYTPNM